ncbi:hypothetical protein [Ornithinimicrobium cerasi]|uniref:Lipoprotein n=1 Tax=Ornithinimicrobium cerasi TaxID=2248773 RepID=A0A285VEB8_9MICO|nr:hypothetical protein [Ornithinimicrobium cerasi]SOC52307.1 hypothetical protein SAMN05421879_101483 [Ornithinimicrobium cerasi]
MGERERVGTITRGQARRYAATLVLALLITVVVTACDDEVEPRGPSGPGVTGRAVLVDDTGLPPRPDGGGSVLLVPEALLGNLWSEVGLTEPDDLAHVGFSADPEVLIGLGAQVVPVDRDGHFSLTRTGPHLLCRLPEPATSGSSVGRVRGCDHVDLPVSGALRVTWGEGGLSASLR